MPIDRKRYAVFFEPQDHLIELQDAGLIEAFDWANDAWHVILPPNDFNPEKNSVRIGDDELPAFALAMTHGALMAGRLTEDQSDALRHYVQDVS